MPPTGIYANPAALGECSPDWLLDPDVAALGVAVDAVVCAQLRALRCPPAPPAIGRSVLPCGVPSVGREAFVALRGGPARRPRATERSPPRRRVSDSQSISATCGRHVMASQP